MKKYLYDYIQEIDTLMENKKVTETIVENHLIKIQFFQHERMIHLLVTLYYGIMFLLFSALGLLHVMFCFIAIVLFIFFVCYVIHYFRLEFGVQYLYKQYDKMIQK